MYNYYTDHNIRTNVFLVLNEIFPIPNTTLSLGSLIICLFSLHMINMYELQLRINSNTKNISLFTPFLKIV